MPWQNRNSNKARSKVPAANFDVEGVVRTMENNPMCAGSQIHGSMLLNEYLDLEAVVGMNADRVIAAHLSAMKTHISDVELLDMLIRTVHRYSTECGENNCNLFLRKGGFEVLLSAMNKHKDSARLQLVACSFISSLGEDALAQPQNASRAQTAASTVLAAVKAHMHDSTLMQVCIVSICSLCSQMNHDLTATSIKVIVQAMRAHAKHVGIQSRGCCALTRFVSAGKARVPGLWIEGAMEALLDGMDLVLSEKVNRADEDGYVVNHPMRVHDYCSFVRDMYNQLPDAAGEREEPRLTVLCRVLEIHLLDPDVCLRAFQALRAAAVNCEKNQKILGKPAMRAAVLAMGKHKDDARLAIMGFRSIAAIAVHEPDHAMLLAEDDMLRILVRQAEIHVRNADVRPQACDLFKVMSGFRSLAMADAMLQQAGCVAFIVKAMGQPPAQEEGLKTMKNGCLMLTSTIMLKLDSIFAENSREGYDQVVKKITQQGVMDAILAALTSFKADSHVFWPVIQFLHRFFSLCSPGHISTFGVRSMHAIVGAVLSCECSRQNNEPWSAGSQMFACSVLELIMSKAQTLESWRKYQDELGGCGGLKAVATCVQMCGDTHHDDSNDIQLSRLFQSLKLELPYKALDVIAMVVRDHAANQDLCPEVVIHVVLRLMEKHSDVVHLQEAGLAAVIALVDGHEGNARCVACNNGCERLAHAIKMIEMSDECREGMQDMLEKLARIDISGGIAAKKSSTGSRSKSAIAAASDPMMASAGVRDRDGMQPQQHSNKAKKGDSKPGKEIGQTCMACGKTAADVGAKNLLKCSACTIGPVYCGAACQRASWEAHKTECKANRSKKT
jgi:hypothetical protein